MLRASALFYSLAISLLIALICSSLILTAFYSRVEFDKAMQLEKVRNNAKSGFNVLLSGQVAIPIGEKTSYDLYSDAEEIVFLTRRQWGVFETGTALSKAGKFEQMVSAMIGAKIPGGDNIALWLSDRDKPLSLCGKTVIKGNCFLPEAGVKRAYIEGQSFTGEKLVDGKILISEKALPPLDENIIGNLNRYLASDFDEALDTVIDFGNLAERDSANNSYLNKTSVFFSRDPISIVNMRLSGNIIIVSEKYVFINAHSELDDVIIYSPMVEIEKDFKGTLQAFGSDTIIVNENCILSYPSVLGLIGKEGRGGIIRLKEGVEISGILFADQVTMNQKNKTLIIMEKKSFVRGMVYCNGLLELKGSVHGSVFSDQFILSTPSSVYENHLLNAEIDAGKLPRYFIGADMVKLFTEKKQRGVVKWL